MSSVRLTPPWTRDLAAPEPAPGEVNRRNIVDGALLFAVISLPVTVVEECVLDRLALVRALCASQSEHSSQPEFARH